MLGSASLELAIGLCLYFFLVSLLCSALREAGETLLKSRARDLERGLRMMLDDPDGTKIMPALMGHGVLSSLFEGEYDSANLSKSQIDGSLGLKVTKRSSFPSYIPARQFAVAFLDIIGRGVDNSGLQGGSAPLTTAKIREAVNLLPSPRLRQTVLTVLDAAGDDLDKARTEVEKWFNGSMDRVSGWYKRRTQVVLFLIGLAVAIGLNLDSVTVAARLSQDDALRAAAVAEASAVAATANGTPLTVEQIKDEFSKIGYPMGWVSENGEFPKPGPQSLCVTSGTPQKTVCAKTNLGIGDWLSILVGWLITGLAVTLGAPFWFDLLNRFISIRSTMKPKATEDAGPAEPTAEPDKSGNPTPPEATPPALASANAAAEADEIDLPSLFEEVLPSWKGGFTNPTEVKL